MGGVIGRVIGVLASYASLIGLLFVFQPASVGITDSYKNLPFWQTLLLWSAIILVAYTLYREISDWAVGRRKVYPIGSHKISDYMYKWISTGGRIAIFTRDMTWASEPKIRAMLLEKASIDELNIFMPTLKGIASELKDEGAHIYTYEGLNLAYPVYTHTH